MIRISHLDLNQTTLIRPLTIPFQFPSFLLIFFQLFAFPSLFFTSLSPLTLITYITSIPPFTIPPYCPSLLLLSTPCFPFPLLHFPFSSYFHYPTHFHIYLSLLHLTILLLTPPFTVIFFTFLLPPPYFTVPNSPPSLPPSSPSTLQPGPPLLILSANSIHFSTISSTVLQQI